MSEPLAVLKGTLDVLVLKALTWQPMHGFEITAWLEAQSRRRLALEDAALYQAVYRLEKRGLIEALEADDRRRPYRLTPLGATVLREQLTTLETFAATGLRRLATP